MEYFNICVCKEWEQQGETKKKWLQVGTLRKNDSGKMFIEMNHMPNTNFCVFEQTSKEDKPGL